MNLTPHQVLRRPLLTEKSTEAKEANNKVVFEVDKRANKIQIRRAIEVVFKVRVTGVNTSIIPGKIKRSGRHVGKRPSWKRAVVTLAVGDTIEFLERA